MKTLTYFYQIGILAVTLMAPLEISTQPLLADDDHPNDNRLYHDAKHNDDHVWNDREDRAYRVWLDERHRKYVDFAKLGDRDRQSYWDWRHDHSDAQLKIDIK
jgi:hypothetical protein